MGRTRKWAEQDPHRVGKRQRKRQRREMCHPATQSARASQPKRKRKHGRPR